MEPSEKAEVVFEFDRVAYQSRLARIEKNSRIEKVEVGHCRDCKRWEPDSEYNSQGNCNAPMANGLLVWVETDRGNSGAIITAPDFGCVQFEAK